MMINCRAGIVPARRSPSGTTGQSDQRQFEHQQHKYDLVGRIGHDEWDH